MITRDMLRISVGNLTRLKLRSFLTISGVVIAIGAFVAMLSFGAGNQRLVTEQFEDLGLLTTLLVFPPQAGDSAAGSPTVLDERAMNELAGLPGVELAYPFDDFDVTVAWGDSIIKTQAQTLLPCAAEARLFSRFAAGRALYAGDSSACLVAEDFLGDLGIEAPDSILGRSLEVSVYSVSPDSGFLRMLRDDAGGMRRRWSELDPDSLRQPAYLKRYLWREAGDAARRFVDGYLNAQVKTSDTLTVRGVLRQGHRRARLRSVIIPLATARRFDEAGPGGDPTKLLPELLSGNLFGPGRTASTKSFSLVTLVLEPLASHQAVADSVEARGFRSFSYAAQFAEIRRVFVFFNLGLAAIGFAALVTAALGIVNTLMMAISERRREIGVLKSLGAQDREIRFLFLVESALIGSVGSGLGIVLGWCVARVASLVARQVMVRQDLTPAELFVTPPWLVATALAFGILVSVLAGWLPAARASRVDPVRALRSD